MHSVLGAESAETEDNQAELVELEDNQAELAEMEDNQAELDEMEDDEFDDNGIPSYDPSSPVPKHQSLLHARGIEVCNDGEKENCPSLKQEEDDNGVDLNFIHEDDNNTTKLQSSTREKPEDSGGTIQDFYEQDNYSKLDERQSAATSYVVERQREVFCRADQDGNCDAERPITWTLGSSNQADTNKNNVPVERSVDAVNCDVPEAASSFQEDFKDFDFTEEGEGGSRQPSSDQTDIGECIRGSEKTPDDERSLTQKTPDDETKTYEQQTGECMEVDFLDKVTEVLPAATGIEDTSPSGRKLPVLPDGGTEELDPGPGRGGRKESLNVIHQDSSARKITKQTGEGLSDVADCGSPEKVDNRSAKFAKVSSNSTKLNFLTMILIYFCSFASNRGVEGTLTVPPGDVLALTGSIARLRCSTDYSSPVYWDRVLFGSDEQETIYYGKNGMVRVAGDRFSVDGDSTRGRYDLVIRNVQLEDAGMYRCIDDAGIGEAYRAELVVSDHFTCEMPVPRNGFMGENIFDIPEEPVESTCRLGFRGNVVPRFQWTWGKVTLLVAPTFINGSTLTSSVTLRATHDMNGARLTCLPIVSTGAAASDDSLRWISESVIVRYVHVMFGSVEVCQSSAMIPVCNPNCTYEVQKTPDNTCQCLAVYNDQGRAYNKIFNEYSCEIPVTPSNTVIAVAAAVAFTVVAAACAIIAIIFLRKKRPGNDKAKDKSDSDPSLGKENGIQNLLVATE